jgi:hypothetical protein
MDTVCKIRKMFELLVRLLGFTKDSLRTCEEQLVWIFAGYDEINYHLVIGRNYSQFILGND